MPDKKELKEVTDPSLLAQLNQESGPKEVTDPALLSQLNETPEQKPAAATVQPQTTSAPVAPPQHLTLAQDIVNNLHQLPQSYTDNVNNIPFNTPGSIVSQITDPHGDPSATGGYTQTRLSHMEIDRQQALAKYQQDNAEDKVGNPQGYQQGLDAINKQYSSQKEDLSNAASHTIDLQLAAKANRDKKYDAVLIGIEKQKALGDKNAEQAEADYNSGRPLPPVAKVMYQSIGLSALQNAKETATTSGQQAIAEEIGKHSDNPQQKLEKDNPQYFTAQRAHQIGEHISKNENPVYSTLFGRKLTQEDINNAGRDLHFTKDQMKDITPENVPSSASFVSEIAQGLTNSAAPIYEGGMRALGALGIANPAAVNKRFATGWEKTNSAGTLFTGQTPDYQEELSVSQPRSVIAAMSKGIGQLGGFLATAETGATALGKVGAAAQTADKVSQFATAALPSYNEAYQRATQLFGESPKDESKRQLYAITNGIIGGTVMMIDPQATLARDIIGETVAGKSFIKTIKNGGLESLTKPELKSQLSQVIEESTKHLGLQTSIPAIQTAAGNISDILFDPEGDHHVMDNVGNAALNGGVAMFIPSIMSGIMHPRNQTAMNKGLMYEVGTNPYEYKKEIGNQVTQGKMSQTDADVANNAIDKIQYIIGNQVPNESLENKPLTQGQKQDYAWNLLKDSELQKKLKTAESTQDKAQIDQVKSKITELTNERNKLLEKAGEVKPLNKPPSPAPEESNPEKADERSVATKSDQGEKPATKKSEETLGNSKEDVSLNSSDITSQEKTTENEKDNGRQTSQGRQESSTNAESTEDGKSRDEARQDRSLENKEVEQAPPASKETAGEPVKRRKRPVNIDIEEDQPKAKEEIPTTKTPDLAAWDLGDKEGLPKADHEQEIRDTPNDQKIGGGESFSEFRDRIKSGWEKLTSSAKDDALLVAHSGVMKMIEAAEKHGWDNTNELRKAYNVEPEPAVGKIIQHDTENGTIHVTRHGQAEDNLDGNLREKDTQLTPKGRYQAVEKVADQLKQEGITPSEIISSDLPRATETADIVKQEFYKPDASTQSKERQQEVVQQGGKPEHARTEQDRAKETPASAENSAKRGPGQEEAVKKRKGKVWNFSEYQARRKKVLEQEPKSLQEHILQTMLGMTDKHPERKWHFGKSEMKDLPESERGTQKYYLNDHTPEPGKEDVKNTRIDVWAQDLLNSVGEHDNPPFDLSGHDSHTIRNEIIDAINSHPSKHHLVEALERMRDAQREEAPDMNEHEYAEAQRLYAVTDELLHGLLDEEAQKLFGKVQEAINEDISTQDSNVLHKYLSLHIGEDGILKGNEIDPFEKDYQEAYDKLSKDGKLLLDTITELDPEKQKELLDQVKQKTENASPIGEEQTTKLGAEPSEGKPDQGNAPGISAAEGGPEHGEEDSQTERIRAIDLQLQREHASQQQQGEKRAAAEKAKDVPAANKANELWYKKQDKIDKLNVERDELTRKQDEITRDEQIKKTYHAFSNKVRAFGDSLTKDSEGMVGAFPGISPHLVKEFTHFVADAIDEIGNVHAAILRAIDRFKEKYPDEKVNEHNIAVIQEALPFQQKASLKEPILHVDNEEYAKDIIADLSAGKISYHDAVKEIMSEDLTDKVKGKILQYVDWHTTDRAERNDDTLDQKGWLNKHTISHSGQIRDYLSLRTDEDVYGAGSVKTKNTEYQETKIIEDLQRSGNDIFNQAQKKYGSEGQPMEQWGAKFLGDVNKLNMNGEDAGTKKVLALTSLGNELQGQSRDLETDISRTKSDERREFLREKKIKTDELLAKVQDAQAAVLHDAAITLNAARVRRLFRNEHLYEMYEQKILSENELKAKDKLEKAENATAVPDEEVNEGVTAAAKEQELALEDEKKASQGRAKKEQKPAEQPKQKNIISRLKDRIKKSTEGDTRGRLSNEELSKGRVNEDSLRQQIIEELKNKKPC